MTRKEAEKMAAKIKEQFGYHVFVQEGCTKKSFTVLVSAENGDDSADYYGERGGSIYPWINPKLVEFAKERDGFWEWQNPGSISFAD